MRGLTKKTTIKATFTADDWDLYGNKGRDTAAKHLNQALEAAVNMEGSSPSSVWRAMNTAMNEFIHLGACDSEPNRMVDDILAEIYTA